MRDGNGELISTPTPNDRPRLTALQRRLVAGVALGAAVIALIGFIGSYAAVRALAEAKHFGQFAVLFPIGLDAGILVLLALDLLLTWLRMPLAMLRHIAWLLTAATIAFNGAVAWPDPIGVSMHAVIPVLFVAVVEAARHAIGTAADISAARHMESVRLARWLLAPIGTFRLWRRMKLWELRSYDEVIALEQQRLIERARLRRLYGRRWRSRAPLDEVLSLRLTRYGRPLAPIEGALAPAAPTPTVEYLGEYDPAWDECAPFDDPEWGQGAPAIAPATQGAPMLPPPPPAAPPQSAPQRPAPESEGAPGKDAPNNEGAPERPALNDQGAPQDDEPTVEGALDKTDEGALESPHDEDETSADEGDTPDDSQPPTRDEAKQKIAALWQQLGECPKEGAVVALLKGLDGYPYTSRRHAQTLRDEVKAEDRARLDRESPEVHALTGT